MHHECKRCLLLEAGESATYEEITAYIATIDEKELVDDSLYKKRIEQCRGCDCLISGMCRKCGCFIEVRARLKNSICPDFDNRKW